MARALQKAGQHELHGGFAAQKAVPREPDFAHATAPQQFLQMVAAEILRAAQIFAGAGEGAC